MKHFIKQRLNEALKGGSITVYHGSPNKIVNFTDEFVGGKEANDQEGPGIYFTSSKENAAHYGEFVYTVTLTPRLLLDKSTNVKKLKPTLTKLVKMATDWEMHAQNYNEHPVRGLNQFVEDAINYNDTEKDAIQQVWIEFYRQQGVQFVRNCVKLGIDGIAVPKDFDGITHYIIYNPAIIKVQ